MSVKEDGKYIIVINGVMADTSSNSLEQIPTIYVNGKANSPFWSREISNREGSSAWAYARTNVFFLDLKKTDTITYSVSRYYGNSGVIRLIKNN